MRAAGTLEHKGREGRIILRRISERCDRTFNSSGSGQKQWQATASTVIEFGVPQNAGNFLNSRELTSFQKGLCPVETLYSVFLLIHRVSQEERTKLRESVPYVKLYRYNPKHLYPKLNGYGNNGQRKVWTSCISA